MRGGLLGVGSGIIEEAVAPRRILDREHDQHQGTVGIERGIESVRFHCHGPALRDIPHGALGRSPHDCQQGHDEPEAEHQLGAGLEVVEPGHANLPC